jgi:ribonucleoside-diphosphate reductase alpha chain
MAWKRGVKSLYYCRSLSLQRAETVSDEHLALAIGDQALDAIKPTRGVDVPLPLAAEANNYEECLSCQ